jgi:hypothetical protein
VLIEYVPRPSDTKFQTPQHRKFWRDYFDQSAAAETIFLDENPEAGL